MLKKKGMEIEVGKLVGHGVGKICMREPQKFLIFGRRTRT
jgi:hypothetical protein